MESGIFKKLFAVVMSVMLAVTMMPVSVFAEAGADASTASETQAQAGSSGTEAQGVSGTEPDADEADSDPDEAEPAEAEASANAGSFEMSEKADDMVITVRADKGIFPEDAVLSVKTLSAKEQKKADAAVEDELPENKKVALSYTFDIKILDADGKELQPAEGKSVEVSFETAYASNPVLEASVYHIAEGEDTEELTAEKLDTGTDEKNETVAAETTGFSYFTVTFTYNSFGYIFDMNDINESELFLYEILDNINLGVDVDDVTEVTSSNLGLIEPFGDKNNGNLAVRVKDFFYGTEYLYVTADGIRYEIAVTCQGEGILYIDENGQTRECLKYRTNPTTDELAGWYVIDKNHHVSSRFEVTDDVHIILCDGVKAEFLSGIHVPYGKSLTIYGQKNQTGKLICLPKPQFKDGSSEYEIADAGIGGDDGDKTRKCGDITINGGDITVGGGMHHAAAIGGADAQANGKITINGGKVHAKVEYGGHRGEGFAEEVYGAAIGTGGGWNKQKLGETPGDITINGGDVTAIASDTAFSAAIGSGYYINGGPRVIINDGYVQAISSTGAAIGAGERGSNPGDVIINGGIVNAISCGKGAGIGGGNDAKGGNITINGGHVTAIGGGAERDYVIDYYRNYHLPNPAIEAYDVEQAGYWAHLIGLIILPLFMKGEWAGAGIGGGDDASGGNLVVNGGTVIAIAGRNSAQAIGHGDGGSGSAPISLYESAKVTYGDLDGTAVKTKGTELYGNPDNRAKMCRDHSYVKIEPGKCSVRFDMQGHGKAPAAQELMGGETAEEPADPEAEGYLFEGWYTEKECVNRFDFETPVNKVVLTLYAKWVRTRDLKVTKKWPEGAAVPKSLEFEYKLVEAKGCDDITRGVTLSAGEGWSGKIGITEECVLEFRETPAEGYLNGSWVLSGQDAKGNAVSVKLPVRSGWAILDLQNKSASGLSDEDFDMAMAAVKAGNAELTITNIRSKVFSVQKQWDDGNSSSYRPAVVKAVLQRKHTSNLWKTVDTVELTEEDGWKGSFMAVEDLGAENASNYRIRELDKNGTPVLDKSDVGSGGKDPVSTLQGYINGKLTDIDYNVIYEAMSGDGLVNITNRAGAVFSVELKWEDYEGRPDTVAPESVKVELYVRDENNSLSHVQVPTKELNEANNWQATFSPVVNDGREYVIREISGNDLIVHDKDEPLPDRYKGEENNKARYVVTEDNKYNEYSYDVTYAADEKTRHTTITNKRTGIFFKVRKNWEFSEGNKWADRVDYVYAVLQHREKDASGKVIWRTIQGPLRMLDTWEESFPMIKLSDAVDADDYRVREQVRHFEGHKGRWPYITYFDEVPPAVDSNNNHYKIMLAADDEDNTEHEKPVFKAEFELVGNKFEKTSFEVSYEKDDNGNFVINNRQLGDFYAEKRWQDSDGSELDENIPESVGAVLQHKDGSSWKTIETVRLTKDNGWKVRFGSVIEENAEMSSYRVRELDKYGEVVYDAADSDADSGKNTAVLSVKDGKGRSVDASFNVSYEDADDSGNFVINNKLNIAAPDADPGPFAIRLAVNNILRGRAEIAVNDAVNKSIFRKMKAYAGETVSVKAILYGTSSPYVYIISSKDGSLVEELDLDGVDGAFTGTFEMPRFPVTVSVKFKDAGDGGADYYRIETLNGAPEIDSGNLYNIATAILTEDDLDNDYGLILVSSPYDEDEVPETDMDALAGKADDLGAAAGTWFDISLYKVLNLWNGFSPARLDEDTTVKLTEVSEPVKLTTEVPEWMQKDGRTYYLLTCHNGVVTVADKGKDTSFSWESSRFSTYMIAYKDIDGGGSVKGSKGNGSINTGDEAHMGLWLTIAILAALELAVLTIMRRRRSQRTE